MAPSYVLNTGLAIAGLGEAFLVNAAQRNKAKNTMTRLIRARGVDFTSVFLFFFFCCSAFAVMCVTNEGHFATLVRHWLVCSETWWLEASRLLPAKALP